jgi:hypothetical protein
MASFFVKDAMVKFSSDFVIIASNGLWIFLLFISLHYIFSQKNEDSMPLGVLNFVVVIINTKCI